MRAIAARHRVLLCVGMLEDAGNLLFNTQLLVGPDGTLGFWRKMHVPMFEMPFYNGGQAPTVVETPLGRIGVNICFDALIPESTRLLAVQNVEIVLFPFAADPPPRTPAGWAEWAASRDSRPRGRKRRLRRGLQLCGPRRMCRSRAGISRRRLDRLSAGQIAGRVDRPGRAKAGSSIADLEACELEAARAEPEYLYRFRRPELYGPLAADHPI